MKRDAVVIVQNLIRKLWDNYLNRVSYARKYAGMVSARGGRVVHDHLAFRTFNTHTGEQPEGISAIRHIFSCFGYQPVEKFLFKKKNLTAYHFSHPEIILPELFVSQLEVGQLPPWAQQLVKEAVKETPYLLSDAGIELLAKLSREQVLTAEAADVLENELANYFVRPWLPPAKKTVLQLNDLSQYAAWVLLHGNSVSHFAAFINGQGVKEWPDIEATCNALVNAGVPMKETIEGVKGSKLQQAATPAQKEPAEVIGEQGPEEMMWTYAYLELTQRGYIEEGGTRKLFSGFLEKQARKFFYMTQTLDN